MLSLACRSCNQTMQAETKEEMVDLGLEHAKKHGHTPPRERIFARIRHANSKG